ncbi:MAG: SufD family Fe-S cluster assembly protein [Oscillospiraceae bacterium]|nr:SufD family Fe-S cluster assembly protein [Oscillospiraceae bacterium]
MYINLLPSITWHRLKMNGVQTEDISAAAVPMDTALPAGWKLSEDTSAPGSDIDAKSNAAIEKALFEDKIVTGAGPDMDRAIAENNIPVYRLTASAETLVLTNEYHEGDSSLSAYEITVPDGVQTTVIEKFYSDEDITATVGTQIRLIIGKGAKVQLVQVQRLSKNMTFVNDIGTINEEKGTFELAEVMLSSAGRNYLGSRSNMKGDESVVRIDMGYVVKGEELLDASLSAFQRGRKTDSAMVIKGTLKDRAVKTMRQSIDFKTGSAGSVGSETEDVLMTSDNVVNKTIPLILCTEEDVEGVHGATLGRPDDDSVNYMKSRGIDEQTIFAIMEKARLDAVAKLIPDEQTRNEISMYLYGEQEND